MDVHWDESIPADIDFRWRRLKAQLPIINQYLIPRCVKHNIDPQCIQLHGFCDASQQAYGACVYIRTQIGENKVYSELLCAKSRVAPIKSVSLPRLELSAALLLSQLLDKIQKAIDISKVRVFLWSDSTIALNWISSSSRKWAVFVANRVGEIQRATNINDWRHISSANNPADILSRGLGPGELLNASMWWHGPDFLVTPEDNWPDSTFDHLEGAPESKGPSVALATVQHIIIQEIIQKFSHLTKTCRVLAYCLRFHKAHRPDKPTRFIAQNEIQFALDLMCKAVQKQAFPDEYKALSKNNAIDASSSLLSLSPFMTSDGILRVGGQIAKIKLDLQRVPSDSIAAWARVNKAYNRARACAQCSRRSAGHYGRSKAAFLALIIAFKHTKNHSKLYNLF